MREYPSRIKSLAVKMLSSGKLTVSNAACFVLLAVYSFVFLRGVWRFWFNREWTTDDALQQTYPFWKAIYPGLYSNDIITKMMEHYLAPIHYWLGFFITKLTGDAVMTGHWLALIQLSLLLLFVFLAVKEISALAPALFAVTWMLHTRHVVQRITGGLPRGWAAPLIAAWMYFVLKGNFKAVLATILIGCFLHPPSTFITALAYGAYLAWKALPALWKTARDGTLWGISALKADPDLKKLLIYIAFCPVLLLSVSTVVKAPPEIGIMATYEEAARMPEFARPDGRFPFVPLNEPFDEIRRFGFHAFIGRLYKPGRLVERTLWVFVLAVLALTTAEGIRRRRTAMPHQLWFFAGASLVTYFLSRALAFRMYVPDRHLQFPFAIFFVVGMTAAVWRAFHGADPAVTEGAPDFSDTSLRSSWRSCLMLILISVLVFVGSRSGLQGSANFNYSSTLNPKNPWLGGMVWHWVRANTPTEAVFAGYPTFMDGCQLFGRRQAYITTETAHPFYGKYYETIKPRLDISLRAAYSRNVNEFLSLLEPEKINYFIFSAGIFYPDKLETLHYFKPFDLLVGQLTQPPHDQFLFKKLPRSIDLQKFPFMPFRDKLSAVVDIHALRRWIQEGHSLD